MKTKIKKIGYTPVDSGQIMLVDPCYVLSSKSAPQVKGYTELMNEYKLLYRQPEGTNGFGVELEKGNEFEHGVIVTGFGGDGTYPVTVEIFNDKDSDYYGATKSVTITFIESED
tara:strand:- start:13284 stop:13625 length:342 start_codon:yes stop_codon:yes gene_type:complete